MIDRLRVRLPAGTLPGSIGQLSLSSLRGVGKSNTSLLAGVKAVSVYLCRVVGNTGSGGATLWKAVPMHCQFVAVHCQLNCLHFRIRNTNMSITLLCYCQDWSNSILTLIFYLSHYSA